TGRVQRQFDYELAMLVKLTTCLRCAVSPVKHGAADSLLVIKIICVIWPAVRIVECAEQPPIRTEPRQQFWCALGILEIAEQSAIRMEPRDQLERPVRRIVSHCLPGGRINCRRCLGSITTTNDGRSQQDNERQRAH